MAPVIQRPTMGGHARLLGLPGFAAEAAEASGASAPRESVADPRDAEIAALESRLEAAVERAVEAEAELASLREGIEAEREQTKETARAQGFEQGLSEGRAAGLEALEAERDRLGQVIEGVVAQSDAVFEAETARITEAVFEATAKIVATVLERRSGLESIVRKVCRDIGERDAFVIGLARADVDLLGGPEAAATRFADLASRVRIEADERVELGGCLVRSASGTVDARLERQLGALADVLRRSASAPDAATAATTRDAQPDATAAVEEDPS